MPTPMTIWTCVAAATCLIILVRLVRRNPGRDGRPRRRFFEIGHEREEIWIPGDRLMSEIDDYDDYDESDDL